jgi:hypothetical protein
VPTTVCVLSSGWMVRPGWFLPGCPSKYSHSAKEIGSRSAPQREEWYA